MAPVKPMNVLVYSGTGTTVESVRQCLYSLRRLLSPHFAVSTVNADVLLKEPWTSTCALLVFPGGADLPYCRAFNGAGNRKIAQYVRRGGAYVGFCAGGYFGSAACEFEIDDPKLAVVGGRELAFFPGICRGAAFLGFQYASENGARAAKLKIPGDGDFRSYFNGGGVFVNAEKFHDEGVEVVAEYDEEINVDGGTGKAAVVYCKVGNGRVLLTGPHPEFAAVNLNKQNGGPEYAQVVDALAEDEEKRASFVKFCLQKLGLHVPEGTGNSPVRQLSRIHLTSVYPSDVGHLVERLQEITTTTKGGLDRRIVDENDAFVLEEPSSETFSTQGLSDALPNGEDETIDPNKVLKRLQVHSEGVPDTKETPYFNHSAFYGSLHKYRSESRHSPSQFGSFLLYGETVTSTNTLLEKNPKLLQRLPNGLTFTATTQIAGRGRGNNVWISPMGSLVFSTCIRHALELNIQAPVIFVQYLVALAIVEGIQSYDAGYHQLQVKLKWPNDIYARDPSSEEEAYVKIGGILVNSSYSNNLFNLVVGCGINVRNAAPTTSLNLMLSALNTNRQKRGLPRLPEFRQEKLLARILVTFEDLYYRFCIRGFGPMLRQYYKHWLHTGQVVTLETEGGVKARIRGITEDYGLLEVEELGSDLRTTGKVYTLQSDGNSFDFFKGLLSKKQ